MALRRILVALIAGFFLFAAGLVIYAFRMLSSVQALIHSAGEIHSTADATRLVAAWRGHSGWDFDEQKTNQFGEHTYDFQVDNSWLYRLHIVPPTMAEMGITMKNGELWTVILVMYSGREPSKTSGVWVQEWFGPHVLFHIGNKDEPRKATVDFPSTVSDATRKRMFGVNPYCFVKPCGCRSAEEMLTDVWSLQR